MENKIRFSFKEDCIDAAVVLFKANLWTWWCFDKKGNPNGDFIPFRENIEVVLNKLERDLRSCSTCFYKGKSHVSTGRLMVGLDSKGLYYAIVPEYKIDTGSFKELN
jgi:hypothetical protein